jgi:hypothetical protein
MWSLHLRPVSVFEPDTEISELVTAAADGESDVFVSCFFGYVEKIEV